MKVVLTNSRIRLSCPRSTIAAIRAAIDDGRLPAVRIVSLNDKAHEILAPENFRSGQPMDKLSAAVILASVSLDIQDMFDIPSADIKVNADLREVASGRSRVVNSADKDTFQPSVFVPKPTHLVPPPRPASPDRLRVLVRTRSSV